MQHAATRRSLAILFPLTAVVLALVAAPLHAADLDAYRALEARSQATCKRVLPAVVGLSSPEAAEGRRGALGMGSGVVVSEDGLILTAGHVVSKPGSKMTVHLTDGRAVRAVGLGIDHTSDAGMARITEPGPFPFVELGRSRDLKLGDWCLAAGHPGGIQQGRAPPVRLGRVLAANDGQSLILGLITDAAVISGDSGGPLFDLDGRLIGIHSNIGIEISENRHVPIDAFRDHWDDLLAGKVIGEPLSERELSRRVREAARELGGAAKTEEDAAGKAEGDARKEGEREKAPPPGMPDLPKFRRMLTERLKRGDPEVTEMAKKGQVAMTPQKIAELMEKWEKQDAAGKAETDALEKTEEDAEEKAKERPGEKTEENTSPQGDKPAAPDDEPKPAEKPDKDASKPVIPGLDSGALQELLRRAKPGKGGAYTLELDPEEAKELMPLIREAMKQMGPAQRGILGDLTYAKSDESLTRDFKDVARPAGPSVVTVLVDDEPVAHGVVVRRDGCILTKASELGEQVACRIGNRTLPATVVVQDEACDLALLKVKAKNLAPIDWAPEAATPVGTWLVSPGPQGEPLALGVVGVDARPIPKSPRIVVDEKRAAIGVVLESGKRAAVVGSLVEDGPAAKAGIQVGDVIRSVDGKVARGRVALQRALRAYEPGATVTLGVQRGKAKKTIDVAVTLGSMQELGRPGGAAAESTLGVISAMGGVTLSQRHSDFSEAFTHDAAIQANQCGGPVLGLDGRAVGLTIARVDRTACYAIPVRALAGVIEKLLAQAE